MARARAPYFQKKVARARVIFKMLVFYGIPLWRARRAIQGSWRWNFKMGTRKLID
jgi:hypothetical protein